MKYENLEHLFVTKMLFLCIIGRGINLSFLSLFHCPSPNLLHLTTHEEGTEEVVRKNLSLEMKTIGSETGFELPLRTVRSRENDFISVSLNNIICKM